MAGRLIAIGDIHGCLRALDTLLEAVVPGADDTVVALGDYVDRGENSRGVIDRMLELDRRCHLVPLCGNHEEIMLDVIERGEPPHAWLRFGGVDTLESYGFTGDLSVIPESHREFLKNLRDVYETEHDFFVHGNYDPDVPLDAQPIERMRWLSLREEVPGPHVSGKRAIVGHTADRGGEIFDIGHLICLDTCCYGGGWLTAMDVATRQLWQANEHAQLRGRDV